MKRIVMLAIAAALFAASAQASDKEKEVVPLRPMWLSTQLHHVGTRAVAIHRCGAGSPERKLPSCADAAKTLRHLTAACSSILLGVIDVDKHPDTPDKIYGERGPLILLARHGDQMWYTRMGISVLDPENVGKLLCSWEALTLGYLLYFLESN